MRPSPQLKNLETMARVLGGLRNEVVVVGGAVVELLTTDPGSNIVRATEDVDVIVEVKSVVDFYKLESRLRDLGLRQDMTSSFIGRWLSTDLILDVMPDDPTILGFSNHWYRSAMEFAKTHALPSGLQIRVIDAPHFVSTKLDAFLTRGKSDMRLSHDFEDIISVINGRPELADEITQSVVPLKNYVTDQFSELLKRSEVLEAIEGALAGYENAFERAEIVIRRMKVIAIS